jgi:hypothetical protein
VEPPIGIVSMTYVRPEQSVIARHEPEIEFQLGDKVMCPLSPHSASTAGVADSLRLPPNMAS